MGTSIWDRTNRKNYANVMARGSISISHESLQSRKEQSQRYCHVLGRHHRELSTIHPSTTEGYDADGVGIRGEIIHTKKSADYLLSKVSPTRSLSRYINGIHS